MISYGQRWIYAFRVFFSLIFQGRVADAILDRFRPRWNEVVLPEASEVHGDTPDRAIQLLALLQRDGRLVDFLMEDIGSYPDAQVGAAVRDVHTACRGSLSRYVTLTPLYGEPEGATVTVDGGADPAKVKVVGNLAGQPPYRGVIRHRGWDATQVALPPLAATGRTVVAPAEIEVA